MSRLARFAAVGCGLTLAVMGTTGQAQAAPSEVRSCQPTLTWGVTLDPTVMNVDVVTEQKLIAKGFATAAFLSRTAGLNLSYLPVGNIIATADGYAGYDYVPSPPESMPAAAATVPSLPIREVNIIVVLADTPDRVLPDGQTSLGEVKFIAGRTMGTYDMSEMMKYPATARTDFYMQMGMSIMKNFRSSRCG